MKTCTFISVLRVPALSLATALLFHSPIFAAQIVLEDNQLIAGFDSESGALVRVESKSPRWNIERRPELGASFRLLVPLAERRDNFVLGEKQHASKVEKVSEHEIRIRWNNLISEHGGVLPITLTTTVGMTNGTLVFSAIVENDSPHVIETLDFPRFGDLNPPSHISTMQARTMWYGNLESHEVYPSFGNEKGYWGVNFPTKALGSHRSLFCLIQSQQEGLYVGIQNPNQRYLVEYTFEQHPGLLTASGSRVPITDEISGAPVHLEFRTCHFLFAQPHSKVELTPVCIRPYQGDWHAGVDLYKEWRATWYNLRICRHGPPRFIRGQCCGLIRQKRITRSLTQIW